ncbi:predicted protein [Coccidioides posadasii str. Silveira]|uniref:Predicted protein n=2 Tax=Coccidioides posadasii TaxID=199306 RepID=E9CX72_COCPS|nr:predicted protein [Coccidioides posadasii str. Silveira]KMM65358.1 hypothetical protein CPAG_01709 [Coccidioides posadasii RMSCC 3488]
MTLKVLRLRLGPGGSLCCDVIGERSGPRSVGRGDADREIGSLALSVLAEGHCNAKSSVSTENDHIQVAFGIMSVQELSLTNLSSFRDTRLGFLFAWGTHHFASSQIGLILLTSKKLYTRDLIFRPI